MIADLLFAAAVAWILYRAVTQYNCFRAIALTADHPASRVSVIVPARNEAGNIGPCVDALLAQDYRRDQLQIMVVDDDSSDTTAAEALAHGDDRIILIHAPPLPGGWTGKCNACWNGARGASGDYLCFIDADVRVLPPLLRCAVACAQSESIDMLSLEPFQRMESCWERMILPAGFLLLAATQDLRSIDDPTKETAAANGQFLLVRREVYEAVGGHAAVHSTVAEDGALAARIKRAGYKVALRDGSDLLQVRMYRSLSSLWEGLSKNIPEMLHGIAAALLSALLASGLAIASIALPIVAGITLDRHPGSLHFAEFCLAVGPSLALLFTHVGIARHFRFPVWNALLFPLAYLLGAALVINSVIGHVRGRVSWKGRTYTPPQIPARVK
ncbi:MAG TPA: glycosyltransferase [Tepidisphaeraceae bacterium]|nr:glycosyltransferase [Tepidisphaeraceae bacterium]